MSDARWYLDSSIALRIVLGHSQPAISWYDERRAANDTFVSSQLLTLEMVRVLRREKLETAPATDFADEIALLAINNDLLFDAAQIRPHIKTLDAIHLASAQRLGTRATTIVSHDANMLRVASELGFATHDPVA